MMKPSSAFTQASITHIGTSAYACLAPGRSGKVLAAFSKAIYLLTDDSELFWIASNASPMHRRALQISTRLPEAQAGSPFRVQDHHLTIVSDFTYDMNSAALWDAPSIDQHHIDISDISARIHTLFASLDLSQAKGFGNFIPDILRLANNESIHPQMKSSDLILVFARPYIMDMANACLENKPAQILQTADALIGLGAGLTPSGDDFIGGLLFCIDNLQEVYPELNLINPLLLEPYRSRTHLISFTLLKDLANGHAIAPLHHTINGLLGGESLENIHLSVSQLTQVGHSTGWDLLTGLLTGLLITYRSNYSISSFRMLQSLEA
jgi:uncharacterized protein DUF2877